MILNIYLIALLTSVLVLCSGIAVEKLIWYFDHKEWISTMSCIMESESAYGKIAVVISAMAFIVSLFLLAVLIVNV